MAEINFIEIEITDIEHHRYQDHRISVRELQQWSFFVEHFLIRFLDIYPIKRVSIFHYAVCVTNYDLFLWQILTQLIMKSSY